MCWVATSSSDTHAPLRGKHALHIARPDLILSDLFVKHIISTSSSQHSFYLFDYALPPAYSASRRQQQQRTGAIMAPPASPSSFRAMRWTSVSSSSTNPPSVSHSDFDNDSVEVSQTRELFCSLLPRSTTSDQDMKEAANSHDTCCRLILTSLSVDVLEPTYLISTSPT